MTMLIYDEILSIGCKTEEENNSENMKITKYSKKNTDNNTNPNMKHMLPTMSPLNSDLDRMTEGLWIQNTISCVKTNVDNYYAFYQIFEKYCTRNKLEGWEIDFAGSMLQEIVKQRFIPIDLHRNMYILIFMLEVLIKTRHENTLNMLLCHIGFVKSKECINNSNLLVNAVESGNMKMIKNLLNCEPEINKKDKDGHTALHVAAFKWYEDMIKLLIDNNADINIKDGNRDTVLHIFIRGAYYISQNLIDEKKVKRIIELLTSNTDLRNIKNRMGETLLHEAVMSLQPKIVYLLIKEYRLLVDVQDEQGWSLLHALIFKASKESDKNRVIETAKVLLSFNVKLDVCDDSGMTPLQFAEYFDVKYLMYLLMSKGACTE